MTEPDLLQSLAACDIQLNVRQFTTSENVKYG